MTVLHVTSVSEVVANHHHNQNLHVYEYMVSPPHQLVDAPVEVYNWYKFSASRLLGLSHLAVDSTFRRLKLEEDDNEDLETL